MYLNFSNWFDSEVSLHTSDFLVNYFNSNIRVGRDRVWVLCCVVLGNFLDLVFVFNIRNLCSCCSGKFLDISLTVFFKGSVFRNVMDLRRVILYLVHLDHLNSGYINPDFFNSSVSFEIIYCCCRIRNLKHCRRFGNNSVLKKECRSSFWNFFY